MIRTLCAVAFLSVGAAWAAPDCLTCRHDLEKALEVCKSGPAGASQDVCREGAAREAKRCEKEHKEQGGSCNLDLLLESPKKPASGESRS
jgi:hypothetical protein